MSFKTSNSPAYVDALLKAGADLYEVGGPVRDRIMGISTKDHDLLCRKLPIKKILETLSPLGSVATVGKLFGVVKFRPNGSSDTEIDIALPRRERSTGMGHRDFDVDFDPNLEVEDDLGRRDFTMNAIALSFTDGRLIDPFGGRKDIDAKILRMVFPKAFEEDPLRLMRAIQFAARFGLKIEDETRGAMKECAPLIASVSSERISFELVKLLKALKPSAGFTLMDGCNLLQYVLPELKELKGIEQDKQPGDDVFCHTMRVLDAAASDSEIESRGNTELLFAALLHDIGKARTAKYHEPSKRTVFFGHQVVSVRLAKKWMQRLSLTSAGVNTDEVLALVENHMFETKASFTEKAIRRFVAKVGRELIFKLLDLRLADNRGGKHPQGIKGVLRLRAKIREELAKKPPFGPKDLAIGGNDIKELGVPEGPMIGFILNALVEKVLDEPEQNEREGLLAFAKEMIKVNELSFPRG